MTTQRDIHNMLTKADDAYKVQVIKQCDCDIEKIKHFEQMLADITNASAEATGKVWAYMNEEI